ncbi:sodium/proline symporter, partial [bacterium]|nr:sodium/proline symporter [bacterium]
MKPSVFLAFFVYFLCVIGVGVYFYNKLKNMKEYFLGGRNLNSWVTAMSAQAADMSGWLLMGLPAAAYISGVSASWIAIGLAVGTYLNWKIIAKRLRQFSSHMGDAITIPQYFQNRFLTSSKLIRVIPAIVIFIFFLIYTASAFNAQAKVFQYLFSMDYAVALAIGVVVILIYTFLGGFMAACWTDLFQGFLMLFAMIIVPICAFNITPNLTFDVMSAHNSNTYLNLFHFADNETSLITIISYFAWGLGYLGMPHILVRFMAIRSSDMIKKARRIAMVWVVLTLFSAVAIGVVGYFYLASKGIIYPDKSTAEIVFIDTVVRLVPYGFIAGVLLSAVLAAIMSTAASQLLVTASTITNDFYKLLLRKNANDK